MFMWWEEGGTLVVKFWSYPVFCFFTVFCVCKSKNDAGDCSEVYEFTPNFQVQSQRIGGKICVPQAQGVAIVDEVGVVEAWEGEAGEVTGVGGIELTLRV